MCLLFITHAGAQSYKWGQQIPDDERPSIISVSWGVISPVFLFAGNEFGDKYSYGIGQYSGIISLSYQHYISKRFSIGITFAYENYKGSWLGWVPGGRTGHDVGIGTYKRHLFTVAPEATFTYRTKYNGVFRMYGGLGIGISYSNEVDTYSEEYYNSKYVNGKNTLGAAMELDNNKYHINGQITGLGMRWGKRLCAQLELGFGYKGVVSTGLTLKL
ncbi:MAG: hypothetical protein K0Q79_3151 [Flavipsychrobacter sp.]|jgi:hypothetical protein|nr:hypothetical protein [Flavipsychrobacter sp.]